MQSSPCVARPRYALHPCAILGFRSGCLVPRNQLSLFAGLSPMAFGFERVSADFGQRRLGCARVASVVTLVALPS